MVEHFFFLVEHFSFFSCPSLCNSFLIFFLSSFLIASKSLSCPVFFSQNSLFFLLFSSLCSSSPFLLPFCLFSFFLLFLIIHFSSTLYPPYFASSFLLSYPFLLVLQRLESYYLNLLTVVSFHFDQS